MKKTKKTISVEDSIEGILRWDIICDMSHRDTANAMWDRVRRKYCEKVYDQVYDGIRLPVERIIDDQCNTLIKEMMNEK